ncbi:MAG: EF-hand domain-containing protein, partial [Planctomycetaceae bacterium]|nr:EF-hand domain-containing protein [Planctomycetaceae bacterium]
DDGPRLLNASLVFRPETTAACELSIDLQAGETAFFAAESSRNAVSLEAISVTGPQGEIDLDWVPSRRGILLERENLFSTSNEIVFDRPTTLHVSVWMDVDQEQEYIELSSLLGVQRTWVSPEEPLELAWPPPDGSELPYISLLADSDITVPTPAMLESFEDETLGPNWTTEISSPGGEVFLGPGFSTDGLPSQDRALHLRVQGTDSTRPPHVSGLLIDYDSESGEVTAYAKPDALILALEFRSKDGLFTGPRPEIVDGSGDDLLSVFHIYQPHKLLVLDNPGAAEMAFGPVLPAGLSRAQLQQDITISFADTDVADAHTTIQWSIDGNPSRSEFFDVLAPRFEAPIQLSSTLKLVPPPDPWAILQFDYHLSRLPDATDAPDEYRNQVTVSAGTSQAYTEQQLQECPATICHLSLFIERTGEESEHPVTVDFFLQSTDATLIVDNFTWHPLSSELIVAEYQIDAAAGEELLVDIRPLFMNNADLRLRLLDEDGQIVVTARESRPLALAAASERSQRYSVQLLVDLADLYPPTEFIALYAEFLLNTTRRTALTSSNTHVLTISQLDPQIAGSTNWLYDLRVSGNGMMLETATTIDQRTCSLDDLSWNGPDFTQMQWRTPTQLWLGTAHEVDPGTYELRVREGACLSTAGGELADDRFMVDAMPPVLQHIPLAKRGWLPPGEASLFLQFNEEVNIDSMMLRLEGSINKSMESGLVASFDNIVDLPLGPLLPGEYRLLSETAGHVVRDSNGNVAIMPSLDIVFVVSDTPPDGMTSQFDLNLDGLLDVNDLIYFDGVSHRTAQSFFVELDLNGDGRIGQADYHALAIEGLGLTYGDVDLDGCFDDDDLAYLASQPLDQRATWQDGDFDGDGYYTTSDLVLAFQRGLENS